MKPFEAFLRAKDKVKITFLQLFAYAARMRYANPAGVIEERGRYENARKSGPGRIRNKIGGWRRWKHGGVSRKLHNSCSAGMPNYMRGHR